MPPLPLTKLWMRRSSSGWIEVPVGFEGEASSTPRVLSPQWASNLGRAQLEALGRRRGHQHGLAVGSAHEVPVAGIARVRHQDLVAGLDQRQAGQLQRRRSAGRDDDAPRRHVDAEALRIPAADALAQRLQAGGVGVLRRAVADGAAAASCTSGGAVKSGSPMFRKIIGRSVCATSRASLRSRLGHLHHVERLDAFGARGDPHPLALPGCLVGLDLGRAQLGARPLSTALTYLWPSVPPNSLASSMHSLSTTRQGTSGQCRNS